ncbi:putative quinol monooxygenase [Aquihabitans sp. McL0605]|uniref:putative quinol monooxygenase n=1 Tax=Aquihabitans sp. McL0605 TaxID=3415671 RepID=UPI003CEC4A76
MAYVQIIEVKTSRYDEIERLHEAWRANTEGTRTTVGEQVLRDRDHPDTYVIVVQFPSYKDALANNDLPATAKFAEELSAFVDEPPQFRNFDVVSTDT